MGIKIGEYIRTPYGMIGKITYIYPHKPYFDDGFLLDNKEFIQCGMKAMKDLKSTPNIIDLIEIGDYVNGYCVEDIETIYDKDDTYTKISLASGCDYLQPPITEPKQIKSIVTKEQFESMEYKIDR